ncbi:hypothetical protein ACLK19_18605 [Escherichia coli]
MHNLLLRDKPGSGISSRVVTPEVNEIVVNPNATLTGNWHYAGCSRKNRFSARYAANVTRFPAELRQQVEEQWLEKTQRPGRFDSINCMAVAGYSGVPRMKNLCQLIPRTAT